MSDAAEGSGNEGIEDLRKMVIRRVARVRQRPTPKRVHKARVALRKVRTIFAGDERNAARALRKDLKAASKALGPVRDADVLLGLLADHGLDREAPLCDRVRKARREHWKRARKPLKRVRARLDRPRTRRLIAAVAPAEGRGGGGTVAELIETVLAFDPALRTTTDADLFHEARIAVKRLRYTVEQSAGGGETRDDVLAALQELQGVLGELHDQDVLVATLVDEAERVPEQPANDDADLRRVLGKARRRHSRLRKRAVQAWTDVIDGGLPARVAALDVG